MEKSYASCSITPLIPLIGSGNPFCLLIFPGEARAEIQSRLSSDIPVLYLQGACGNTSTRNFAESQYSSDFDMRACCERTGRMIGEKALMAMADKTSHDANAKSSCERRILQVPARHRGPEDMSLYEAHEFLSMHPNGASQDDGRYNPELWKRYWADSVVMLEGAVPFRDTYPMELSLFRLGNLAIVTNPGELFVEYQLDVKRQSPFPNTMVVELANGYCGYIPTELAFKNGGYETRLARSSYLSFEAGRIWVDNAVRLLHGQSMENSK